MEQPQSSRRRIEETYVESLRKLHRKVKSVDLSLDERGGELSTVRAVWSEVVENVDREAQTRQALCATLTTDIIIPLTSLKETQERTRKRIKEDLKDSGAAYTEYAEMMLPKLKSRYTKKYMDVEEQKRAALTVPNAGPLNATSLSPEHHNSNVKAATIVPARPTVTAPQPLRALDRRPSGSTPGARNRSPSSSTAFSDLAHQGKKQLNQLIGFLDKGGVGKDGLGVRENQALRTVRAKRDADEADREYRKGVHWLETLRLRRTKILESGYKSLEMFIEEASTTMKTILEKYADNMTATTSTQTQLSLHMRGIVDRISPEKDVAKLKTNIPRSLASAIPDPILYEHGLVGECNDLIFGFSLVDYATAKGLSEGEIPKIIRICIEEIDKRGLECEGIYRVSGRHAIVQGLQHEIERDESAFEFTPKDDVYAVSSLLKLYLRELPEPVFRFSLQDRIQHTEDREEHISNNFMLIRSKIRRLPPVHQATLKALIEHLSRIVAKSNKNKMDAKNLAIVFGGVIFGDDEMPKGGDLLSVQTVKDTVMEDLILNASVLYDTEAGPSSPPLPPTPVGEPIPKVSYGSRMTKITTVPPIELSTSPQDFTPRLPARPNNSIHPSSRIIPSSPTKPKAPQEKALPPTVQSDTNFEDMPPPSPVRRLSRLEVNRDMDDRNSIYFPAQDSPTRSLEASPNTSSDSRIDLMDTPRQ
ncbi:Rho GTPase-activating protein 15 [Psilocybe cubensis]|uniref:Rho GTPase-activating protein 15 n=1 Tax=Psilocybe cubensis TaxID=181762 RepID=A0ACB8HF49_PSICU|nr:Rho GTPase-activating protein 15 [Psilocybe cubensis]KAH9486648.1 Rho GTPase-activating protein 15 [Psilocybe cubensis]